MRSTSQPGRSLCVPKVTNARALPYVENASAGVKYANDVLGKLMCDLRGSRADEVPEGSVMWECLVCAARIDEDDSVRTEDGNMRDHVASHIQRGHIPAD